MRPISLDTSIDSMKKAPAGLLARKLKHTSRTPRHSVSRASNRARASHCEQTSRAKKSTIIKFSTEQEQATVNRLAEQSKDMGRHSIHSPSELEPRKCGREGSR